MSAARKLDAATPPERDAVAPLRESLRLINVGRRKGWVEGYAQALLDTGPTPPTPEIRDAWMARYRERATAKYPQGAT